MITGFVQGQKLTLAQTTIAADAVNYLTGRFIYVTKDWCEAGLSVWVHFKLGDTQIDAELTDGEFGDDAGVNLAEGIWDVWLTGHVMDGSDLVRRLTTIIAKLTVSASGVTDGEPLPTGSFGEAILGQVQAIYGNVGEMIRETEGEVSEQLDTQNQHVSEQLENQNQAVTEQLAAQDAAVDARLDDAEGKIDSVFGGKAKNWKDGLWIRFWAGTSTEYASAEKEADTIYLIDCGVQGAPTPPSNGCLKNWKDNTWIKLWAGSAAEYAEAEKSADTIYLVGFDLAGGETPAESGGGDNG